MPGFSFSQNTFADNSDSFQQTANQPSEGKPADVVQREMDTKSSKPDVTNILNDKSAEEQRKELVPEVTPQQLETLANRLVPRIKRSMRAEMERSIFR